MFQINSNYCMYTWIGEFLNRFPCNQSADMVMLHRERKKNKKPHPFSIKSCSTLYIQHFIQIKLLGIKTALNILHHYILAHSTLNDMLELIWI